MGQRKYPLHLNTANGQVSTDDIINVACSPFEEGGFVASVLPSTPSVISVGERCMSYGYGFHWPAWSSRPYLESPGGRIIWLAVENKLPYLYTGEDEYAAPAQEDADTGDESDLDGTARAVVRVKEGKRIAIPALNASDFYDKFNVDDVPPIEEINRRLTLDMHTTDVLG